MRMPQKVVFIALIFTAGIGLVRAAELTKEEQAWLARAFREETGADFDNIKRADIARRVRWLDLFHKWSGKVDVDRAKLVLADHYDVYLEKEQPGARTICGHWELDATRPGRPGTPGSNPITRAALWTARSWMRVRPLP